jgi:nicotinamidase/pyrazinamidase
MRLALTPRSALLCVDVQRDFCPGGALAVPEGDKVVPVLNEYVARFRAHHLPIFATRDWHPPDHVSFRARGGPWPAHCVQDTRGAELHPDLALPAEASVVSKGTDRDEDAYSGFQGTNLAQQLRATRVERVFVGGLATDYCVRATALDAIHEGFQAFVLEDAVRGIDARPGDSARALEDTLRLGAVLVRFEELAA